MLKIVTYPDPILTKKCSPVILFNEKLSILIDNMFETMKEYNGIGLAANQVGISQQIFIMKIEDIKHIFINPDILKYSIETIPYNEGCLSFPTVKQDTNRCSHILLKWQDITGQFHQHTFDGLDAICIQHEIEHLNGKTFLDLLSPLKKQFALKKYLKIQKA